MAAYNHGRDRAQALFAPAGEKIEWPFLSRSWPHPSLNAACDRTPCRGYGKATAAERSLPWLVQT
jgi:hypothetical protein